MDGAGADAAWSKDGPNNAAAAGPMPHPDDDDIMDDVIDDDMIEDVFGSNRPAAEGVGGARVSASTVVASRQGGRGAHASPTPDTDTMVDINGEAEGEGGMEVRVGIEAWWARRWVSDRRPRRRAETRAGS